MAVDTNVTVVLTQDELGIVKFALDSRRQQLARAANAAPTGSAAKKGYVQDLDAFESIVLKFK